VRLKIRVRGIVQGVGFRPFIYRIAVKNQLAGYVRNRGDAGVEILIEGEEGNIKKFMHDLREKKPPLARIPAPSSLQMYLYAMSALENLETQRTQDTIISS